MQTLKAIDPATASAKSKELLAGFEKRFGRSSNMLSAMAQSPVILEAYLQFNRAFEQAKISSRLRGLVTTVIAQHLGCEYMLSIAAVFRAKEGITTDEFEAARSAESADPKIAQALRFAKRMIEMQGRVASSEVESLRRAGYSDEEIVELIGLVALNVFRNYFNLSVQTEVDLPVVRLAEPAQLVTH